MDFTCYKDVKDVIDYFSSCSTRGLTSIQVINSKAVFGKNKLPPVKGKSFLSLIMEQFEDLLVLILLGSAVISFFLGFLEEKASLFEAFIEPVVILLILIANAIVGVVQETNAAHAIRQLKNFETKSAAVIRDGNLTVVSAEELVPGDLIKLSIGERVPADCRLAKITSTSSFMCDESMLTGEALPVTKSIMAIPNNTHTVIQDMTNMLFSGSLVVKGKCLAIVVQTGSNTELGKIHRELEKIHSQKSRTPLQQKLDVFATQLSKIILVICILVWAINIGHFTDPEHGNVFNGSIYYFKIAVSLAVAAIPEGLPAVVTTCLALGTKRMARQNAIVRTLSSVETLGCTTIICSDKTGTLTTNKMTVRSVCTVGKVDESGDLKFNEFNVSGEDYSPTGSITNLLNGDVIKSLKNFKALNAIGEICEFCNDSTLTILPSENVSKNSSKNDKNFKNSSKNDKNLKNLAKNEKNDENLGDKFNVKIEGVTTEVALKVLSKKLKIDTKAKRILLFDFDRSRKIMSSFDSVGQNNIVHVKGAPESLLSRCTTFLTDDGQIAPLNNSQKNAILRKIDKLSSHGLRVLGFARKIEKDKNIFNNSKKALDEASNKALYKAIENENPENAQYSDDAVEVEKDGYFKHEKCLTFCGFCGMLDPPRKEVVYSINKCQRSGIRVIVITGDHQSTAESICRKIGIFRENEIIRPPNSEENKENLDKNRKNEKNCDKNKTGKNCVNLTKKQRIKKSITASEFMLMTDEEKKKAIKTVKLYSRVEPKHKLELVQLLKESGEVVAMTGDGVNDASALRCADIGIAMGSGTQVAQHAADMVLQDDNFATIVNAVESGRAIFANMKQFIRYLISSNIGEVICVFLTALLGLPEVLIPVQLLWVNLVTDGLPATALGFNAPDRDIMRRRPRRRAEPIITGWLLFRYAVVGVYIGVATVLGFIWWHVFYSGGSRVTLRQLTNFHSCGQSQAVFAAGFDCSVFSQKAPSTISLSILVTVEMFNAFNALSENASLLKTPPWSNKYVVLAVLLSFALHFGILYVPFFRTIFSTAAIGLVEWLVVVGLSAPVIVIDEILKWISARRKV